MYTSYRMIFQIEAGKLLVKNALEKWVGLGEYHFSLLLFFLAFVFAVAVVVCLLFGFS